MARNCDPAGQAEESKPAPGQKIKKEPPGESTREFRGVPGGLRKRKRTNRENPPKSPRTNWENPEKNRESPKNDKKGEKKTKKDKKGQKRTKNDKKKTDRETPRLKSPRLAALDI